MVATSNLHLSNDTSYCNPLVEAVSLSNPTLGGMSIWYNTFSCTCASIYQVVVICTNTATVHATSLQARELCDRDRGLCGDRGMCDGDRGLCDSRREHSPIH